MKNIKILDCTLRDGGRIINCAFDDNEIKMLSKKMADAKIDIIEIGFLRDKNKVEYQGNSTFFTDVEQIEPFIINRAAKYVAFVDYGMFDFDTLRPCNHQSITGIRVGFTKKDKEANLNDIIRCLNIVKKQGYKLYVQGVNTLNYSDKEILELVELMNEIKPYSFGIVDTYGAMYLDDIDRIFEIVDHNLAREICIDFHSHNNYQMSFSLAQEVIKLSKGVRKVIIDATLSGMGKVAGNLNTELIADYMVRKLNYNYNFNLILDLIDNYIFPYEKVETWGYSIPALISGIYQAHPNNVRYLTSKFRLQSKDIKNIMAMISPELRQKYDYENIERLYQKYVATTIDDLAAVSTINREIGEKEVLVLVPGETLISESDKIQKYIEERDLFIISVNHVSNYTDWSFWGNSKQYELNSTEGKCTIITSNIKDTDATYVIDYYSLINQGYKYYENSTLMLLNLLKRLDVQQVTLAGFDGFIHSKKNNYINNKFQNERHLNEFDELNSELEKMLLEYYKTVKENCGLKFLTQSRFETIIEEK